jgi:pSer/pThr/pTyr-binding forkhead associated (FHA) protein
MGKEYIIGRCAASQIKIPIDREGVSSQHAKITINDKDNWMLEDLQSTNGTFLRNESGEFKRVYTKQINESDVIRLGNGGANSFIFMAHRLISSDDTYQYEFKQLRLLLRQQREQESKQEHKIELNAWISKASGLAVVALCWLVGMVDGINVDPNFRYLMIAFAPIIVGFIFNGDRRKLRVLRKRREHLLICPKCGKPIPEFDVEQGQCSRCKAK